MTKQHILVGFHMLFPFGYLGMKTLNCSWYSNEKLKKLKKKILDE